MRTLFTPQVTKLASRATKMPAPVVVRSTRLSRTVMSAPPTTLMPRPEYWPLTSLCATSTLRTSWRSRWVSRLAARLAALEVIQLPVPMYDTRPIMSSPLSAHGVEDHAAVAGPAVDVDAIGQAAPDLVAGDQEVLGELDVDAGRRGAVGRRAAGCPTVDHPVALHHVVGQARGAVVGVEDGDAGLPRGVEPAARDRHQREVVKAGAVGGQHHRLVVGVGGVQRGPVGPQHGARRAHRQAPVVPVDAGRKHQPLAPRTASRSRPGWPRCRRARRREWHRRPAHRPSSPVWRAAAATCRRPMAREPALGVPAPQRPIRRHHHRPRHPASKAAAAKQRPASTRGRRQGWKRRHGKAFWRSRQLAGSVPG